jgi:benzodiazapine receptor
MENREDTKFLQITNIVGFVAVVVVNILANALPINGKTTAELSDSYPNLFVPAGYVFAIWGVIYLLLLAFTVYQTSSKRKGAQFLGKIGYLFGISCASNVIWIFLWHYELLFLSLIAMFVLLGSLIMIYLRLDIGRGNPPREERLYVHLPFSVYLGWITVAPIANVVATLVSINWDGFGLGEVTWTMALIAVAVILTLLNIQTRGDIGYTLVIVWALGGIIVKQMAIQGIVTTAGLGIIVLVAFLAFKRLRS